MKRMASHTVVLATTLLMGTVVVAVGLARAAPAATFDVALPIFIAKPGDTVKVFLDVSAPPALHDIRSVEYRLTLGASVIHSARVLNEGFVTTWGAPFVNASADSVLLACAGGTPVATSNVRMSTVELIIDPSAPSGTDLPLTFTRLLFNEGTPSVSFTPGMLKIRSGTTDVEPGGPAELGLRASPNPARGAMTIAWRLPAGVAGARLEMFTAAGRRVRSEYVTGRAGAAEWQTRGRDEPLAPGLYFVRLRAEGRERVARVAVLE